MIYATDKQHLDGVYFHLDEKVICTVALILHMYTCTYHAYYVGVL